MPTYNGKDRKDVLIRQVREAIAEENRKDIIERLWKGRQERVRRGLPPGGTVPYGYQAHRKMLMLDDAEIEVVRLIFQLAAEPGVSDGVIADALNTKGFIRRNGKQWTQRQVAAILHREPFYRSGTITYGVAHGENRTLNNVFGATTVGALA